MALREHYPLTIAFIDINDLKEINDHFGHEMGDLMIKSVSKTLLNHVRKSDLIARVGGDELIAIFPKCTKEAAKTILYRSHTDLEELGLDACGVKWSFSSGCVEYQKDESVDDVIKRADAKMYKEKERYRLTKKKNIDLNNLKHKDK
jgi:diguanylate cyclase (GGDEF)-like protein